jgi:hypothetical protein
MGKIGLETFYKNIQKFIRIKLKKYQNIFTWKINVIKILKFAYS